jgi:hypothetical protein
MPFEVRATKNGARDWQNVTEANVKVNKYWQPVSTGYVKINGAWELFYSRLKSNVINFQKTNTNDSVTFTWNAAPNVQSYQFWLSEKPLGDSTTSFVRQSDINLFQNTITTTQKLLLTQGSRTVTGVGTTFTTTLVRNNILYSVINNVLTEIGMVSSIQSNTSLTLAEAWTGFSITTPGTDMIYQKNNSHTYLTTRERNYVFYLVPIEIVDGSPILGDRSSFISLTTPVASADPITDLRKFSNNPTSGSVTLQWTVTPRYERSSYRFYDDGGSPYQYGVTGNSGSNIIRIFNQESTLTTSGFSVGWGVAGTGIRSGAVITAINTTTGNVSLSLTNTGTVSGDIRFYPPTLNYRSPPFTATTDGKYERTYTAGQNRIYRIQIEAFNALGEGSGRSNIVEYAYTPNAFFSLARPRLTASISTSSGTVAYWSQVNVRWTNRSTDVDFYRIYYKKDTATTWTLDETVNAQSFTDGTTISRAFSPPNVSSNEGETYNIKVLAYGRTDVTAASGAKIVWTQSPVESTNIINYTVGTAASSTTTITSGTETNNALTASSDSYFTKTTERRVRTQGGGSPYGPWFAFVFDDGFVSNVQAGVNYSAVRQITSSVQERDKFQYTGRLDFSASGITLASNRSLDTARLRVTETSGTGNYFVQVGNAAIGYYEWTDSGNIDRTNDQLYRKLIDSKSRVLIQKSTVGLSFFNENTARLTVEYNQTNKVDVDATSGEYTLSNNPWVETIV